MMEDEMYFDTDEMPKNIRRRKKQLYKTIRERMEFYFSDANLQKDRFLAQLLQNDPQVDLSIFLRFNRIQQLTHSTHDLAKALKKSEFLQLNEDKTKVFRTTPVKEKENVDACTIYVEQLTPDADHDWLTKIFSKYGKVDYVSIPKYKSSGKIKGFAFVEFEKPEYAKLALDEFEKEGLCLTSHMDPEQLCSIATHEEEKPTKEQPSQQETNSAEESEDASKENDKKAKKRKNSEPVEESKDDKPKEKKSKKEEAEGTNDQNDKPDQSHVNNNTDNETAEESDVGPVKKKKNRKKKKSHKMKYVDDIKLYGLHILSKPDWKRLRNKYLNIQKEKMKRLKQHLYKSQLNHLQRQQQVAEQQQQPPPTKPRFEFTSGLVIKVLFDEPLQDNNQVSQFKSDAKSLDNVEYVDVTQGSTEGYIRFRDKNTVQEIIQSKPWENMAVLEGAEEEQYWEKMKRDRAEKFENRKKFNNKSRGRNKLVNKAEKLISKRIRLSVDE